MKRVKVIYYTALITCFVLATSSCKKYFDINYDPNKASSTSPDLLLPTAELYMGNSMGDRLFQQTSVWCQYYTGGPGVALGDWDKNTMATGDGNQVFSNFYRASSNLAYIDKNSGQPYYQAVAKILTSYAIGVCVDLFGDIPYTDALKGDIVDGFIVAPKYDNAKDVVYPGVERELKRALTLLDTTGAFKIPASDDLLYGASGHALDEWKKFAKSLLLKLYLRQGAAGKQKFADLYDASKLADFIVDNEDNALIKYPGDAKGRNPFWTDAKSTSLGNYYAGSKTSIDYLLSSEDPRLDSLYNPSGAGTHVGLSQGDVENSPASADYSRPNGAKLTAGGKIFNPSAPVMLMTAWEVSFILAEAAARGWIESPAAAEEFYVNGVLTNAEYLGVSDEDIEKYLEGAGQFDLQHPIKSIAMQRWVCMNGLQPVESWIETRRVDNLENPIFTTKPGGIFKSPTRNVLGANKFPSILYYPGQEQDLNNNFPGQHTLNDKVFWDN